MKRRILVVITARPSYSRIKTVLKAIQSHPRLELQLVISGSALLEKYGNVSSVIERDGFNISEAIYSIVEGETPVTMAKSTGLAILELSTVFAKLNPDIVITIADRYETIATSIAASFQNIPLCHVQGGEVTGNIDEKVRHANTKLADIHLVSSEEARERVIKLGEDPAYVINTGCPSIDIAREAMNDPELYFDPIEKYGGVGASISSKSQYVVVMQHPVTTDKDLSVRQTKIILEVIHELNLPTFWFWPNVDAGSDEISKSIRTFREHSIDLPIRFFKNMDPSDFLKLLINSSCLIGNSSVGIRECSFLGVPVVNIGSRQNKRTRGRNVVDIVTDDKNEIKEAVRKQILRNGSYPPDYIYGDGFAGDKMAEILSNIDLRFHKTLTY